MTQPITDISPPVPPVDTTPPGAETYLIQATADQAQGVQWACGYGDRLAWMQDQNNAIMDAYVRNYKLATAPVPTIDVATAYANADAATQQQVIDALGLTPPPVVAPMNAPFNPIPPTNPVT